MGIKNDFASTFGASAARAAASTSGNNNSHSDQVPAKYWMNTGYTSEVTNDEGQPESVFVSLRQGVPLDNIESFDLTKIRNPKMASLRAAQNDLHDQLMEVAEGLAPGEAKTINIEVEIRRVNEAVEAPAAKDNTLIRKLSLA